jgi:hypothetical protein
MRGKRTGLAPDDSVIVVAAAAESFCFAPVIEPWHALSLPTEDR